MPKHNPEELKRIFEERNADRPFFPHATCKTREQEEKEIQTSLLDTPRIGHGQTEPEALDIIRLDLDKKTGTPVYIDREVKLT